MNFREKLKQIIRKKSKDYILRDSDFKAEENLYYADISAKFGNAQMILYLVLLIFVALSLLIYSDSITYKNLYYFAKDFGTAIDVAEENSGSITYNPDSKQSFSSYKGGLCVVGNSAISVLSASGRKTFSENVNYSLPKVCTSKKYLLAYDLDGTDFSICNSFSELYSSSCDNKITGAVITDSGMFAISTFSNEYNSEVFLYNSAFNLINSYKTNNYVMDMSISPDGKKIAVLSFSAKDAGYFSELKIYNAGETTLSNSFSYSGKFPLGISYSDSGILSVLFDTYAVSYDKRGNTVSEFSFESGTLRAFSVNDSGIAAFYSDKTGTLKNRIIIFDNKGKVVYNKDVNFDAIEIELCGQYLFAHTYTSVKRINIYDASEDEISFEKNGVEMTIYSDSTVLMCGGSKAWFVDF